MKLWDMGRGTKIRALVGIGEGPAKETIVTFDHIDGMYSYCTTPDGHVVHLSAGTPLKKVGANLYEIDFAHE